MIPLYISVYDINAAIDTLTHHSHIKGLIMRQSLLMTPADTTSILQQLVPQTRAHNIHFYLKDNRLLHNQHIPLVKQNLLLLKGHNIGLFIGDPAVIAIAQELEYDGDIIFAPEMILTSHQNAHFWITQGADTVEISHELTFRELNAIINQLPVLPFVQIHGQLSMFQSRRLLVDNYFTHLNYTDTDVSSDAQLSLYDHERDLNYIITQDERGTEIYNGQSISIIDLLNRFDVFPNFVIDTYFLTPKKRNAVIQLYIEALQDQDYEVNKTTYAHKMQTIYGNEPLSRGFFLKPTIF